MTLTLGTVLGIAGVSLSFISFAMKNMVSLRWIALASNFVFLAYGYVESQWPGLVLNAALLPVNGYRLREIYKLTNAIKSANQDSPVSQWLLPHMTRRAFKAGDALFRKGDPADEIIYIASGRVMIQEIGHVLGAGELLGEIGLFSPTKERTQSVVCETDGELYRMTGEMIEQLYFQNPKLGFFFMRLIVGRLLRDVQRASAAA